MLAERRQRLLIPHASALPALEGELTKVHRGLFEAGAQISKARFKRTHLRGAHYQSSSLVTSIGHPALCAIENIHCSLKDVHCLSSVYTHQDYRRIVVAAARHCILDHHAG